MAGDRIIGMVQTRPAATASGRRWPPVGCAGRITSYAETSDGRYLITLTGLCRFQPGEELPVQTPYRQVRPTFDTFESDLSRLPTTTACSKTRLFFDVLKSYLDHRRGWRSTGRRPRPPRRDALVNSLAIGLPFDPAEKQALLEAYSLADRRDTLIALMEINSAGSDDDEPPSVQ